MRSTSPTPPVVDLTDDTGTLGDAASSSSRSANGMPECQHRARDSQRSEVCGRRGHPRKTYTDERRGPVHDGR
jgi:hypothetical protein